MHLYILYLGDLHWILPSGARPWREKLQVPAPVGVHPDAVGKASVLAAKARAVAMKAIGDFIMMNE